MLIGMLEVGRSRRFFSTPDTLVQMPPVHMPLSPDGHCPGRRAALTAPHGYVLRVGRPSELTAVSPAALVSQHAYLLVRRGYVGGEGCGLTSARRFDT